MKHETDFTPAPVDIWAAALDGNPRVQRLRLRDIAREVEARPKGFDMRFWHFDAEGHMTTDPACGTVHCIAGWAAVMAGERVQPKATRNPEIVGLKLLGKDAFGWFHARDHEALSYLRFFLAEPDLSLAETAAFSCMEAAP